MSIRFTRHAREKFALLARHGFVATEEQVIGAVLDAERIENHGAERIAQKAISETHVLRVVFRAEGEQPVTITFYPGRRKRCDNEL